MKSRLLISTLIATLSALPVVAGGPTYQAVEPMIVPAAAPAPVTPDWQGLHFGIAAARPTGDNFWAERGVGAESAPGDWSGTMPSLSAGYDWQRGRLVYGVTLAVYGGDMTAALATSPVFGCPGCETTVDKLATLRGRVGLSMGRTLVFASAGAARADAIGTATGFGTVGEDSLTGWTAGVGVERFFSQRTTISAEYLHTDLGRLELPTTCATDCFTDIDFGQVQLGINYHW